MRKFVAILAVTTALAGTPSWAQSLLEPAAGPPSQGDAPTPANEQEVTFASDTITYDTETEVVIATGNVRMARRGDRLRDEKVEWNQKTGEVRA